MQSAVQPSTPTSDSKPTRQRSFFEALFAKSLTGFEELLARKGLILSSEERDAANEFCKRKPKRTVVAASVGKKIGAKLLAASGIDGDLLRCTFDGFDIRHPLQGVALKGCRRHAEKLPDVPIGVALCGPTGVGKTHLGVAMALPGFDRAEPVRSIFVSCADIGWQTQADKSLLSRILKADHVILNDLDKALLGNASMEAYQAVAAIINHAAESGRPILTITAERPLRSLFDAGGKPIPILKHQDVEEQMQVMVCGDAPVQDLRDAGGNSITVISHVLDAAGQMCRLTIERPALPGFDLLLKPYLVSRLAKVCHWQWLDGPDGRDPQYWLDNADWRCFDN